MTSPAFFFALLSRNLASLHPASARGRATGGPRHQAGTLTDQARSRDHDPRDESAMRGAAHVMGSFKKASGTVSACLSLIRAIRWPGSAPRAPV